MNIKEWAEKKRIVPESATPTKIYSDGREGQYFCKCCHCDKTFIGDKRDVNCGKCMEGDK